MDPRDVPNHSPAHTHSFFDANPGHPNPVLRSPPLSHDPPYGMHGVPSAFSVMGRRPGLPDFRGSLTHDPILGSQSALTSPGSLHGSLTGSPGGAGWWMPPHPHARGLAPEYFTSHLPSSWLSHEHDRPHGNHDRLEECLYPSARSRSNLMNGGVTSVASNVFGSGSGIFYPPPTSPQSLHSFVHQSSPTTTSKTGLSHWGSHGNHEGRSSGLELNDSHDLEMIPCFDRRLSNCSEESNDQDSEMRPIDLTMHHKETGKDAKSDDFEKAKNSKNSSENLDLRSAKKSQPERNVEVSNANIQRQMELAAFNENSHASTQQTSKSAKKNKTKTAARSEQDNSVTVSPHESKSVSNKGLSTPPKLQKVKSGPPPRLQVPKSILNTKEGIVPKKPEPLTKAGASISSLLREEILKPTAKLPLGSDSDMLKHAATAQNVVLSQAEGKTKKTAVQGMVCASKVASASQKPASKTTPNQPKIPSGKPPLIAHFHAVKLNEDSSDEGSDTSNVSSDSESGSASDEESEEGEEGENEEDSSGGSDSESEGSDDEGEGAEQQDEDDDDEDDEDEVFSGAQGSETSFEITSPSKRKVEDGSSGTPRKRRRAVDEDAIGIPLENGWRRQTRLRQVGAAGGLRGDVYYFAPCGKKLRTYPEVTRYLSKNGITDITLENFSFSTKLHIGEFLECKQGSVFEPLTEEEVGRRKEAEDEKKRARLEKINSKKERKKQQAEMAQKAVEAKLLRKAQRQATLEAAKMAKRERVRMLAEQKRLAKERAREQRQLARRKKKEDAANAKYEDAMKKAKERELKRQQAVLLKQQEKEQKRQQQMMIRAIESQRKAEERERLKEEKRMEKKLIREKKLEQKRREMILARELKKPVEDMVLKDSKVLPELPRAQGVQVPGGAFADLLMVQEFVHNFGEALDLESSEIPTLWEMQSSLLNDSSDDVFVPLCQNLLISALEDPGCEGPDSFTVLGVPLVKVELNESNFSEVLRLFILSRNAGDPHVLSDALTNTPFQALPMSEKAGVMSYLCNELLCSRTVCKEIENSIEHMSNLRRDKWVVEGKIRKLKAIQADKYPVVKVKKPPGRPRAETSMVDPEGENSNSVADDSMQGNEEDEEEEEEEEEDDDDDDDDDDGEGGGDGTQSSDESDEEEDNTEPTTQEELERRLKKFEKKHAQFRSKLFSSSHALRALSLGQDRYKRRYWILPHGGGVFAEGMETAEKEIILDLKPDSEEIPQPDAKKDNMEVDGMKQDGNLENKVEGLENHTGKEPMIKSPLKSPGNTGLKSPLKSPMRSSVDQNVFKPDNRDIAATFSSSQNNSVAEAQGGSSTLSASQAKTHSHSSQGKLNNTFAPDAASRNTSDFQRIENLFRSEASTSKTEHLHVQHSHVQRTHTRNPWFSLIPRMPCDECSLTLSHSHSRDNFVPTYSKRGDSDVNSTPPPVRRPPGRPPRISSHTKYDSADLQAGLGSLSSDLAKQAAANQFVSQPIIKRPPGRPPKLSYEGLNLDGQACLVPQPVLKRPPGRPPKLSYEGLNLSCLDGQQGPHPMGSLLTSTSAMSTQSVSTTSLSFEELKKNVLESLMQEPAPIPPELQHGWWRITEPSQLKEIVKLLHSRGIREKILQKSFQKYMEYANSSCTKGDPDEEDSDDERTEKSSTPQEDTHGQIEDKVFPQVTFAINKATLKEVEEIEEKVFAASLQVKGWRLPPKASKGLTHKPGAELKLNSEGNPLAIAINRLEALELAVERRYLKHPMRNDKLHIPTNIGTAAAPGEVPTEDAQPSIEKMDVDEEIVTPALRIWRNAVLTSESASQLSMCLSLLYDCIAWEKSIMKVFCQICRKGDNEELLLLCDGCDRGYHTYCCMPKLSSIPEGDWYCTDCIVLAAGGDNCCMCGGATGKMAKCDNCPRNFHLHCLEPPLSKVPRASWTCPTCKRKRSKPRRKRKIKELEEEEDDDRPLTPPSSVEVRPHANRKQSSKDMAPCRMILAEMEKHDDAWPFLVPVNPKQFPEYYQIIKKPMDFHTMKIKLRDCQYGLRNEFVDDARTVFLNCEEFNEDDSEVGQAGKRLLRFFERRWEELSPTID